MDINRHNYEEFFLMYVDGELSAAEKVLVENFLQQNPDLEEEMEMLKDAVLRVEKVSFDKKELLYKNSGLINRENYEEYFLMSVDEELSQSDQKEVEKFVLKHPELQQEYTLLQKAKLQPEVVVFKEKEALYKTIKRRPVAIVNLWRFSAVAACISFIVAGWLFTQKTTFGGTEKLATIGQKEAKKVVLKAPDSVGPTTASVAATPLNNDEVLTNKVLKRHHEIKNNYVVEANAGIAKIIKPAPVETVNKSGQGVNNSLEKVITNDALVASVNTGNKNDLPSVGENPLVTTKVISSSNVSADAIIKPAVYHEIDNEAEDEERSFYIGSAEINKNKLKGLFKKAASLFERKNTESEEGRTLKIAGFEIKSR